MVLGYSAHSLLIFSSHYGYFEGKCAPRLVLYSFFESKGPSLETLDRFYENFAKISGRTHPPTHIVIETLCDVLLLFLFGSFKLFYKKYILTKNLYKKYIYIY